MYKDAEDLTEKLQRLVLDEAMISGYRRRAQMRIKERYDWDSVVDQYESLFARMADLPLPQSALSMVRDPGGPEFTVGKIFLTASPNMLVEGRQLS